MEFKGPIATVAPKGLLYTVFFMAALAAVLISF